MQIRGYAELIAMALGGVWLAGQPAAAAECGATGQAPCPTKRAKPATPKATTPQRANATPSPTRQMQDDAAFSPTAAVDIMPSKIQDIIIAEPKGDAKPADAWRESETGAESASGSPETPAQPLPSRQPAQMRRHGPED